MTVVTGPYTAKIAGSAVNVMAGTLSVANQIGQRSTGAVGVWGPLGTLYQYGTQIAIYDDTGALAYSGYISKDVAKKSGSRQGTGYLEHSLTLMDNCYRADKRVVFTSYLNTTAGAIAKNLVDTVLAQEGVTYTASSIASGVTVPEVIWMGRQISSALDWLAKNSGYWWNIDINGVLWFQPYGGVPAPFSIDGTQVDALGNLSVECGNDQYVNTQYTKGGYAEKGSKASPLTETFHGNSLTRSFTLSYPVSRVFSITLNGSDVTAQSATKGSTGALFYYAPGDSVVAQDTSQTLLGSGDTLIVTYAGRAPAIGKAQANPTVLAAQRAREGGVGTGIIESVYSDPKVHTLPGALSIASALLAHYGQDMTVLTFDTRQKGLMEGQQLTVNLADFALANKAMLITAVGIDDQGTQESGINIWFHITAVGSPLEPAQWQTFWQNVMNQQSDPSDLSDVNDLQFTVIVTSAFTHAHSFSAASSFRTVCPICGPSTLCGPSKIVC